MLSGIRGCDPRCLLTSLLSLLGGNNPGALGPWKTHAEFLSSPAQSRLGSRLLPGQAASSRKPQHWEPQAEAWFLICQAQLISPGVPHPTYTSPTYCNSPLLQVIFAVRQKAAASGLMPSFINRLPTVHHLQTTGGQLPDLKNMTCSLISSEHN